MKPGALQSVDVREDAWSLHLRELFESLDIAPGTLSDNLIASISMYCRKFNPKGVQSRDLNLLVARAFCAVGDRAAADSVLNSMEPHRRHRMRWLEILSERHHFPELLPYFSLAIIRPADWAGAQLDRMWILDFGRLVLSDSERHEIMLYRSIRVIIEKIGIFWDATRGEGVLGLKDLSALSVETMGQKQHTLTTVEDLLGYIADLFEKQKGSRDWATTPLLLNLDL